MTIRTGNTPVFDIAKEEISVYVTEQFDLISTYEVMFVELLSLNCKDLSWGTTARTWFPKHIEKIVFSLEKEFNKRYD